MRRGVVRAIQHPIRFLEQRLPTTWRLHYGIRQGWQIPEDQMEIHRLAHNREAQNGWMADVLREIHARHQEH